METKNFEAWKIVLACGVCGACPAVEMTADGVTIGEEQNVVQLTLSQWNDLVSRIKSGELTTVANYPR
jgi:hypothetical protein